MNKNKSSCTVYTSHGNFLYKLGVESELWQIYSDPYRIGFGSEHGFLLLCNCVYLTLTIYFRSYHVRQTERETETEKKNEFVCLLSAERGGD